jgi:hypothetical protein
MSKASVEAQVAAGVARGIAQARAEDAIAATRQQIAQHDANIARLEAQVQSAPAATAEPPGDPIARGYFNREEALKITVPQLADLKVNHRAVYDKTLDMLGVASPNR